MSDGITLTDRAAKRIATILEHEGAGAMLRIQVEGGGCSGFQYKFDFTKARNDDDRVIEKDGATVLVDDVSMQFMGGTELDWVDDLIGSSFKINNPNVAAACGCGTSFTV